MYNVTLVCTRHREIGECNSRELYKIIEQFNPEIIFEELSLAAYNRCYNIQDLFTLETSAIKLYRQNYNVKHISVVGSEMNEDHYSMIAITTKHNSYRNLIQS